jgi:hypothetical protein
MPFATTYGESTNVQLAFALLLRDRYAQSDQLVGAVNVNAGNIPAMRRDGATGCFVFLNLKPGAHTLNVTADQWTPYYRSVSIPVVAPPPPAKWPAYPDITLANRNLRLDDPAQPAAFRKQFLLASLLPTAQYPFDSGATLVRGQITSGGAPLADATVSHVGGDEVPYVTDTNGEFVLFFEQSAGVPQPVTLRATHAAKVDKDQNVTILRGTTVVANIDM